MLANIHIAVIGFLSFESLHLQETAVTLVGMSLGMIMVNYAGGTPAWHSLSLSPVLQPVLLLRLSQLQEFLERLSQFHPYQAASLSMEGYSMFPLG